MRDYDGETARHLSLFCSKILVEREREKDREREREREPSPSPLPLLLCVAFLSLIIW